MVRLPFTRIISRYRTCATTASRGPEKEHHAISIREVIVATPPRRHITSGRTLLPQNTYRTMVAISFTVRVGPTAFPGFSIRP